MSSVFDAHSFAVIAHAGQLDKAGQPYIRHLERVANAAVARAGHARATDRLDIDPMRVMQAAILHDVLEDTPTTPAALQAAGFPPDVVRMVRRLTRPTDAVPYADRIALVAQSGDLGAILIKMSDNEDNLSPDRTLPDGAHLRARYAAAFETLREAAARLGYTGP